MLASVPAGRIVRTVFRLLSVAAALGLMATICVATAAICVAAGGDPVTATAPASTAPETFMRAAWTTSRIRGAPTPPEPYRIVPAYAQLKFQKPSSLEEIPGAGRLLVTEMAGRVFTFLKDPAIGKADPALDLVAQLPVDLKAKGVSLLDAEFHPRFAENRYVYLCYVHPANGGHTRVSRFTLGSQSPPVIDPTSEHLVITWPSGGHNAGCLEFGTDGYLYISTGDGTGPNPPDGKTTGQTVDDLLGAVLRIEVERPKGDAGYSIPSDNPFVATIGARGEVWAYGLRNPWKFGIDPKTGAIFAADNGWETWEMVHRIIRGGNCGWPVMEGRARLRSEVAVGPTPIIPPVKDHHHSEANSVIGGPVYRGSKLPGLDGAFVYGDYITGTIWSVRQEADGSYTGDTLCDTDLRIVAFTEGSAGELLVLDYDLTGQIYELEKSNVPDTSATFPRKLSETGLFSDVRKLTPADGLVPYAVRVNRWMDGAAAKRWVAVPGSEKITLATALGEGEAAPATYPEGTVFVKHLELPAGETTTPIRLETQLLHYEAGTWRPYTYLWNDEETDAMLVDAVGASRPLSTRTDPPVPLDRTWHANAVNECKLCHNAGPKFVLGFTTEQLDFAQDASRDATPQLQRLFAAGVLAKHPELPANYPLKLVDPFDTSLSLEARARSYLHANCSMCHHPGGNAIVSFYLRRDLPFEKLNTNKGTGIGTFGMTEAKLIVPYDPYRSVLMYRMSKLGYARMPYIGSRLVDSRGVALIEAWIRMLPTDEPKVSTSPADSSSPTAAWLATLAVEPPGAKRDEAIRNLLQSTEGALAAALYVHRDVLSPDNREALIALGAESTSSNIRGLFDTFLPESKRKQTLGATFDLAAVLKLEGDADRGKLIYSSDGARCKNCHELNDAKKSLGPTLVDVLKKYPQPADLLEHVAKPSLKVEDAFAAYAVTTADGRSISGLVAEQSDREVVLKTAEKLLVRLPRSEIEEMTRSPKSLMPDGVLADLTAQEAADLLRYLRSQVPAAGPAK
jgi:putative heme-binding domain-containing protein